MLASSLAICVRSLPSLGASVCAFGRLRVCASGRQWRWGFVDEDSAYSWWVTTLYTSVHGVDLRRLRCRGYGCGCGSARAYARIQTRVRASASVCAACVALV
eukprot:6194537-Pleurochrysis_carterae.AAC.3